MNTAKFFYRFLILSFGILVLSGNLNAQSRRHYERRDDYRYYSSRPVVSIGFGVRNYGYYPSYPYYSNYEPAYRYYPAPYFGLHISTLPFGYNTIYVGPDPFYYYQGTYYRPYGSNQYEVTTPPLGARVPELPKNAKVAVIDGQKYYQSDGTYYKEDITDNNEIWYTVVGTNGELNTGNTDLQKDQVGDRVENLPADSKAVVINKQKYYLAPSGIYYQEITEGNKISYEVVGKSSDLK
ncbi:MAG: DUF6515 family protein [Chitinophagales bacterium]